MKINTTQHEYDLISSVLTTKDQSSAAMAISGVSESMIYDTNAKRAWKAIKSLSDDGQLVDVQGVAGRMGGSDDFLWLAEVIGNSYSAPANVLAYSKRVKQSSYLLDARNRAVEALTAIDELTDITKVGTVADSIESLFDGLLLDAGDNKPVPFKEVAKTYIERLNDKINGKADEHIILSNIADLDQHTGGFNNTDLITIGGMSGSGKTEFAVKVMTAITQEAGGSLIFSLEMSNEQVVERAVSSNAMLPVSSLRNPERLEHNNGWAKVSSSMGCLIKQNMHLYDQTGLTVRTIISMARAHKVRHPDLKVIVVDHVGLMEFEGNSNNLHHLQVGEISKKLKLLAKDLKTPVVLLTQLVGKQIMQRGVKDRIPVVQDIKDSSRIEEDSDLILLCHRQQTHDEKAPDIAEIVMGKARHAIKGTKIYFRFWDGHFVSTDQAMAFNTMDAYYNAPSSNQKSKDNF